MLTLVPLAFIGAALVGGISLMRRAEEAGFSGTEVVGEAGVDYIVASGLVLLTRSCGAILLAVLAAIGVWLLLRTLAPGATRFQVLSFLAIAVLVLTAVRVLSVWHDPGEPSRARVVLETQGRFCADVVLRTPSRIYAVVNARGSERTRESEPATTVMPTERVVTLASPPPPGTACKSVNLDKVGG